MTWLARFALLLMACSDDGGGGGASSGGGIPPTTPSTGTGEFSSVWQAASMEVTVFDKAAPATPLQRTIEVPPRFKAPTTGKNVELYVTFEGEKRISYARYENTNVYYRIAQPAFHYGDGETAQYTMESGLYMLEGGVLTLTTSRESDGKSYLIKTTFRTVTFPPAGWPTEKIDHEAGEDYP